MCLTTIKDGGTLEREASVTLSRTDDAVPIKDKVNQAKGKLQQTIKSYTAKVYVKTPCFVDSLSKSQTAAGLDLNVDSF